MEIFTCLIWARMLSRKRKHCMSSPPRGCTLFYPHPHNMDWELKERLPMKDFFPVFMSSSLWRVSVCLLRSVEVTDCTRKTYSCNGASLCLLSLQLWSEKSAIHRQITFPAALPFSLCRLLLLSVCMHQIAGAKHLWRTCLSSSLYPTVTPQPPPSNVLSCTRRTRSHTKQKQASGYGSHERGSPAGGGTSFHEMGSTWATQATAASLMSWHKVWLYSHPAFSSDWGEDDVKLFNLQPEQSNQSTLTYSYY